MYICVSSYELNCQENNIVSTICENVAITIFFLSSLQRDYGYDTEISYTPESNNREVGSCVERGADGECLRPMEN